MGILLVLLVQREVLPESEPGQAGVAGQTGNLQAGAAPGAPLPTPQHEPETSEPPQQPGLVVPAAALPAVQVQTVSLSYAPQALGAVPPLGPQPPNKRARPDAPDYGGLMNNPHHLTNPQQMQRFM